MFYGVCLLFGFLFCHVVVKLLGCEVDFCYYVLCIHGESVVVIVKRAKLNAIPALSVVPTGLFKVSGVAPMLVVVLDVAGDRRFARAVEVEGLTVNRAFHSKSVVVVRKLNDALG